MTRVYEAKKHFKYCFPDQKIAFSATYSTKSDFYYAYLIKMH